MNYSLRLDEGSARDDVLRRQCGLVRTAWRPVRSGGEAAGVYAAVVTGRAVETVSEYATTVFRRAGRQGVCG
jgi:hypothetical protein